MSDGKIGVVDVGGGFRGVYAAGVLDWCMDQGIRFDLGIGVSAGSANLISYCAGQRGRNYHFYVEYGMRKEYASVGNFLRKRSFVDMDYVYGTLSNSDGENPLDYAAAMTSPMEYFAVATEKVLIVAPDDTCGVSTLTRDAAALESLYNKGLQDGRRIEAFL